ncbi:hypothetical protein D3C76_1565700 [compost metagenome]
MEPLQYFRAGLRLLWPQPLPLADYHPRQQLAAFGKPGQPVPLGTRQGVVRRGLQIDPVGTEQRQRQGLNQAPVDLWPCRVVDLVDLFTNGAEFRPMARIAAGLNDDIF